MSSVEAPLAQSKIRMNVPREWPNVTHLVMTTQAMVPPRSPSAALRVAPKVRIGKTLAVNAAPISPAKRQTMKIMTRTHEVCGDALTVLRQIWGNFHVLECLAERRLRTADRGSVWS